MLDKKEIKKVAKYANAMIDIPLVPEFMEQKLFEHGVKMIVDKVEEVLPAEFKELISSAKGISSDHGKAFADKLIKTVNNKVDIPYLDEDQEAKLFGLVINIIVKAMTANKKLSSLLPA